MIAQFIDAYMRHWGEMIDYRIQNIFYKITCEYDGFNFLGSDLLVDGPTIVRYISI